MVVYAPLPAAFLSALPRGPPPPPLGTSGQDAKDAAKKETYSQAMERLEKIVRQIDNNELDIDILSEKIKEANEIIAFCTEKLTKADREVEKLLQEKQQSEE